MWGTMTNWLTGALGGKAATEGLSTAEMLGMGKEKGIIGTGKHHGADMAHQLGMGAYSPQDTMSYSQATPMEGLMSMSQAQPMPYERNVQVQAGLMNGQPNPWTQSQFWQPPPQGLMY